MKELPKHLCAVHQSEKRKTDPHDDRPDMPEDDKQECNNLIASDLIDAGFDITWLHKDGMLVTLQRRVSKSEVMTALDNLEYDGLYTATQLAWGVVVDAVV